MKIFVKFALEILTPNHNSVTWLMLYLGYPQDQCRMGTPDIRVLLTTHSWSDYPKYPKNYHTDILMFGDLMSSNGILFQS
jgi:hypothetical protein